MAKAKNEQKPAVHEEKADVLIVKPGMRFVAKKDCFISAVHKEGETVEFAPGQEAPMNLVSLVSEEELGEEKLPEEKLPEEKRVEETPPGDPPGPSEDGEAKAGMNGTGEFVA